MFGWHDRESVLEEVYNMSPNNILRSHELEQDVAKLWRTRAFRLKGRANTVIRRIIVPDRVNDTVHSNVREIVVLTVE